MPPYEMVASVSNLGKPFFQIKYFVLQRRINSPYLLERNDTISMDPLLESLPDGGC